MTLIEKAIEALKRMEEDAELELLNTYEGHDIYPDLNRRYVRDLKSLKDDASVIREALRGMQPYNPDTHILIAKEDVNSMIETSEILGLSNIETKALVGELISEAALIAEKL